MLIAFKAKCVKEENTGDSIKIAGDGEMRRLHWLITKKVRDGLTNSAQQS